MHPLQKNCLLFLILFITALGSQAQTSCFSFSLASHPLSGWINIAGDPHLGVQTGTDAATGFTISSISTANWSTINSQCAFDNGGQSGGTFFPASVMVNQWFQYGPPNSGYNASTPQLIVSGLSPNSLYTFKMTGSQGINIGTIETNPTRYTVTGAVVNSPIDVNCDNNTANGAVFQNIAPDATGKVKIYINTSGSANLASISGVQIITGQTSWTTTGNAATSGDVNFVGTVDANRLTFRTNNIERMTILSNGTVGIGTQNPQGYALAVNGTGIFTKIMVKPYANWPDYVFKKDFHLPSLPELERYIRLHQHLPGVASEQEVVAGGIDVSRQEAALLKKVEELTLYVIEQNKRLEAQQKQIDQLKALMPKKSAQK